MHRIESSALQQRSAIFLRAEWMREPIQPKLGLGLAGALDPKLGERSNTQRASRVIVIQSPLSPNFFFLVSLAKKGKGNVLVLTCVCEGR